MPSGSTICTEMPGSGAQDWYGAEYYAKSPADDPTGPDSGVLRVLRGGSWYFRPFNCRSASRDGNSPDNRINYTGFRLARTP